MENFEKVVCTTVFDGLTSQLGQYSFPCPVEQGELRIGAQLAKAILKGTAGCLVRQHPFSGRSWTWSQRGMTG